MRNPIIILIITLLLISCNSDSKDLLISKEEQSKDYKFKLGGAPVEVTIKAPTTIALTDYLDFIIEIRSPKGYTSPSFFITENVYTPFILFRRPEEINTYEGNDKSIHVRKIWYQLEPTSSGNFTLKEFNIPFRVNQERPKSEQEEWKTYFIATQPISIQVTSVKIDPTATIKGRKGLILPPFQWIKLAIGLALLLAINFLIFLYWKWRNRSSEDNDQAKIKIDYCEIALEQMELLEKKQLLKKGEIELFHVELSSILRDFIEQQFKLKANEQTSEEFLNSLVYSSRFNQTQKEHLKEFLNLADLVKFATYEPEETANNLAVNTVKDFIITEQQSYGI